MRYNKVNTEIINKLKQIVGQANITTEKDALENYAHDETPLYHALPEVVVKPGSTEEISQIMKIAYGNTIPVTARSGGTSLSAGAVPVCHGIVLSFERMDKIKDIDKENLMVVVEPGIITEQVDLQLAQHSLFYPPDPVSLDSCMIGGNIAENAGGPRAMKYGVTKNYVLGLEVVLSNGQVQRYGGKLLKNVTGYDIIDLIVGSEGTLAIITEATLRVLPRPCVVVDLLIPFKEIKTAVDFATEVLHLGYQVASIELMDGEAYRMVAQYLKRELPHQQADAHIIVEIEGNDKQLICSHYNKIGDIALKYKALEVFVGENQRDKERIWEPRKNTGDALKEVSQPIAREDLVVPRNTIPELITRLRSQVKKYGAHLYAFGHLGDGNIHADASIQKDKTINNADVIKMRREIYETTLSLEGTITAEHGIGLSKVDFLELAMNRTQIELMKKIKDIFDPKNILNPGKIFKIKKGDT
jgi:glycolate oxidase